MKNKKDKPDWIDDHIEVIGINDKSEKAFKEALKEKTIEMLGNELTKESEVKDD